MNKGAEFDTMRNRELVEVTEQKRSMSYFRFLENEPTTSILNPLETKIFFESSHLKGSYNNQAWTRSKHEQHCDKTRIKKPSNSVKVADMKIKHARELT